jgi:hypothetical protein
VGEKGEEEEEDQDIGMLVLVEEKEADGWCIMGAPLPVCGCVGVCMRGVAAAEEEEEDDKEKGRMVVLVPAEAKEEEETIPSILPAPVISADEKEGEEGPSLLCVWSTLRIAKASRREGIPPEEEETEEEEEGEEEAEGTTSILPPRRSTFPFAAAAAVATLIGFLCL